MCQCIGFCPLPRVHEPTDGGPAIGLAFCVANGDMDKPFSRLLCGTPPAKMPRACACLSLDVLHIVFAIAQLIQQWTCLTYARHVLVEIGTIRSEIANGHFACLVYALHV